MKGQILDIVSAIDELYESPKSELVYHSNYELLVAVILSAQCTDKRVNIVTKDLFEEFNTPEKMIELSQEELEKKIHACGFFHDKAKHILEMSNDLIKRHNGEVPSTKKELLELSGVGEKTANVMLATGFGVPAIAVDTHVFRVSNRLGLAKATNVQKTQRDLEKNIPKDKWIKFHHALVLHGRYVCKSQKPKCDECGLKNCCKFFKQNSKVKHK